MHDRDLPWSAAEFGAEPGDEIHAITDDEAVEGAHSLLHGVPFLGHSAVIDLTREYPLTDAQCRRVSAESPYSYRTVRGIFKAV